MRSFRRYRRTRPYADPPDAVRHPDTRGGVPLRPAATDRTQSLESSMRRVIAGVMLMSSTAACAVPRAAGAPLAPLERAWEVPTLELYSEWWRKTEECSARAGDMSKVTFYAVDAPNGAI